MERVVFNMELMLGKNGSISFLSEEELKEIDGGRGSWTNAVIGAGTLSPIVASAVRGAQQGARFGRLGGPWGVVAGAVVGAVVGGYLGYDG
mgnify:CR=1 FL=1